MSVAPVTRETPFITRPNMSLVLRMPLVSRWGEAFAAGGPPVASDASEFIELDLLKPPGPDEV